MFKYLVYDYVEGIWGLVDYQFDKLEKDLKPLFDPEGFETVTEMINKHRDLVIENAEFFKHKAISEIEVRKKALAKNPEFGTAEWKFGVAKDLINSLPDEQFVKIIDYSSQINGKRMKEKSKKIKDE